MCVTFVPVWRDYISTPTAPNSLNQPHDRAIKFDFNYDYSNSSNQDDGLPVMHSKSHNIISTRQC